MANWLSWSERKKLRRKWVFRTRVSNRWSLVTVLIRYMSRASIWKIKIKCSVFRTVSRFVWSYGSICRTGLKKQRMWKYIWSFRTIFIVNRIRSMWIAYKGMGLLIHRTWSCICWNQSTLIRGNLKSTLFTIIIRKSRWFRKLDIWKARLF